MATASTGDSRHTLGASTYRTFPRLRTKPSTVDRNGRRDSGGGYERVRSWEVDPTSATSGKEDVYASHHRLLAVVECYPSDVPVGEILAHLDGRDVHHRSGVEWDNRPGNLAVREHSTHAEITQSQMRAWAEDDRRRATVEEFVADQDRCARCDEIADVLTTSDDWEGEFCLECGKRASDGAPIEVS